MLGVQEPLGGAHADPMLASQNIKEAVVKHMEVSDHELEPDIATEGYRKGEGRVHAHRSWGQAGWGEGMGWVGMGWDGLTGMSGQ